MYVSENGTLSNMDFVLNSNKRTQLDIVSQKMTFITFHTLWLFVSALRSATATQRKVLEISHRSWVLYAMESHILKASTSFKSVHSSASEPYFQSSGNTPYQDCSYSYLRMEAPIILSPAHVAKRSVCICGRLALALEVDRHSTCCANNETKLVVYNFFFPTI